MAYILRLRSIGLTPCWVAKHGSAVTYTVLRHNAHRFATREAAEAERIVNEVIETACP